MNNIHSLNYQLKNTSCDFVSFRNNRFYFRGRYEQYKIMGYKLLENVANNKKTSEVYKLGIYRFGVYRLKDFDGYKIMDMKTGEIFETKS